MAGFFGLFNYTKPGKGVDVNAPPKKPFFRFFELLWRRFSRFIVLNLITFIFLLPILSVINYYYCAWYFELAPEEAFEQMIEENGAATEEAAEGEEQAVLIFGFMQTILLNVSMSLPQPVALTLLLISCVFYGPAMCGMSYMMRNFTREEHAWMSDFFVRMKMNFKQGLALGLLELFTVFMLFLNISSQAGEETSAWVTSSLPVIKYVSIFLLVLILFVRQYMYTIAVTFDLRLSSIIKNSFAFAIIGLPRNLFLLVIDAVFVLAALVVPYCDILLIPLLFFSFLGFLTVFTCYPLIHKHMILPLHKQEEPA